MYTGNKYDQKVSRHFEETLSHLIKNYYKTLGKKKIKKYHNIFFLSLLVFLEFINLELKNNKESLDNLLFQIVEKCPKLKRLFFDGNINGDMDLFSEICKYKQSAKGKSCSSYNSKLILACLFSKFVKKKTYWWLHTLLFE